jgi:hypothetical protein
MPFKPESTLPVRRVNWGSTGMRSHFSAMVLIFLGAYSPARADTLEEIAAFASKICNQSLSGGETSTTIEAKLNGDVNGLAKALGITVGAGGLVKQDGTHYEGIPKEKLPTEIPTEAQCRTDLAKLLIAERQQLQLSPTVTSEPFSSPRAIYISLDFSDRCGVWIRYMSSQKGAWTNIGFNHSPASIHPKGFYIKEGLDNQAMTTLPYVYVLARPNMSWVDAAAEGQRMIAVNSLAILRVGLTANGEGGAFTPPIKCPPG